MTASSLTGVDGTSEVGGVGGSPQLPLLSIEVAIHDINYVQTFYLVYLFMI